MNNAEFKSMKDTLQHIDEVTSTMDVICKNLSNLSTYHDMSKTEEPEAPMFAKYSQKLSGMKYGSDEYNKTLDDMKGDCLLHHYENNSHHPEHYPNGVSDMDLMDIIEMLADWKAASKRMKDGNFRKSLVYNMDRFNVPEPLKSIILRSEKMLYKYYLEIIDKDGDILYSQEKNMLEEFISDVEEKEIIESDELDILREIIDTVQKTSSFRYPIADYSSDYTYNLYWYGKLISRGQ